MYAGARMDLALYAIILLLFATWSTFHLLLCFRLRLFGIRRAFAAFLVPPLAPYWGLKYRQKAFSFLWLALALAYLLTLLAGFAD